MMSLKFPSGYSLDDYNWENQEDTQCEENGILKNELGITDIKTLNIAERDFSELNQYDYLNDGFNVYLTDDHYQYIHKYLFHDIYPWAGEFRTVDIAKNDSLFIPVQCIGDSLRTTLVRLHRDLRATSDDPKENTSNAFGRFIADVNTIHPFREGNGRTQRTFTQKVANNYGYDLNFSSVSNERMKTACIAAFDLDYVPMTNIVRGIIKPKSESLPQFQDDHLIENDAVDYISYKDAESVEGMVMESGTIEVVSDHYVLLKNLSGYSVYQKNALTTNYVVGDKINEDGVIEKPDISSVDTTLDNPVENPASRRTHRP